MKIYLARHGQNKDNANGILNGHRDLPLTDLGRAQAEEIAINILKANLKFDKVITSPLSRAHETAQIIAKKSHNPTPETEELLTERDFGVMTGIPHAKIKELCSPDIIETDIITYFLNPDGAETFPDLVKRAKELLTKIDTEYEKQDSILLVSHGDFGKMIYAAYYDLPWKSVLTQFHFGNSELLLLSEDSSPEEAHIFEIKQHNQ